MKEVEAIANVIAQCSLMNEDRRYIIANGLYKAGYRLIPEPKLQSMEKYKLTPEGVKEIFREFAKTVISDWHKSRYTDAENKALAKVQSLIEQARQEERERIFEDFKVIWEFMEKERNKGRDKELIITAMGMIHDYIVGTKQALKGIDSEEETR